MTNHTTRKLKEGQNKQYDFPLDPTLGDINELALATLIGRLVLIESDKYFTED